MTTGQKGREPRSCPYCGKGGLTWDYASRTFRCTGCDSTGIREESLTAQTRETPQSTAPQKLVCDAEQTFDSYVNDERVVVYVHYDAPKLPQEDVPQIDVNEARCGFVRYRLADQIRNEARYGRDHLRKTGYRITERVRKDGQTIKVWGKSE